MPHLESSVRPSHRHPCAGVFRVIQVGFSLVILANAGIQVIENMSSPGSLLSQGWRLDAGMTSRRRDDVGTQGWRWNAQMTVLSQITLFGQTRSRRSRWRYKQSVDPCLLVCPNSTSWIFPVILANAGIQVIENIGSPGSLLSQGWRRDAGMTSGRRDDGFVPIHITRTDSQAGIQEMIKSNFHSFHVRKWSFY